MNLIISASMIKNNQNFSELKKEKNFIARSRGR